MENDNNKISTKKYDPDNPLLVGGQAVIEGVMMRAPGAIATAVRRANGKIELKTEAFNSITEKYKWLKMPILRGAVGLIEMMIVGIKTLNYSAEIAMEDTETEEEKKKNEGKKKGTSNLSIIFTMLVAFAIGMAVFFILPLFITTKVFNIEREALLFNLVAGSIRLIILLCYITLISFMKDIKRIFQYHGAEHKTVLTFEGSKDLILENTKAFTTFHPRCGTSFLLVVMLVAILCFSLLDAALMYYLGFINLPVRLAVHLPFIPILGGVSYEFMRFSAKRADTGFGKMLIAPGLWLQRITTSEPDDQQIEVALCALNAALEFGNSSEEKKN
jgi:uncharacterized protein YqhQ